MSNLRNKLIRLAHARPEIRKDILPLLGKTADKKDKKAGLDKGIFWEYVGTDYDNEIAYRDDVLSSWFDNLSDALKALASKKGEAKRKGFKGRGIRFEKEGWNAVSAHVRGSSDQMGGDELFYHHQIKFQGFEKDELKALISLISKF